MKECTLERIENYIDWANLQAPTIYIKDLERFLSLYEAAKLLDGNETDHYFACQRILEIVKEIEKNEE